MNTINNIPEELQASHLKNSIMPFMRKISSKIENLVETLTDYELEQMKSMFSGDTQIALDTNTWWKLILDKKMVQEIEKQYHAYHLNTFINLQKRAFSIYALEWIITHSWILTILWEIPEITQQEIQEEAINTYRKYMDIMLDNINSSANRLWNIHKAQIYKEKLLEYGVKEKDIRGIPET